MIRMPNKSQLLIINKVFETKKMKICFSIGVHDAIEDALISKSILKIIYQKYSSEFVCGLTDHTKSSELRQIFKKVFN